MLNSLESGFIIFLLCVVVNSVFGSYAGTRSAETPTKATPKGYFFTIWLIIYLALLSLYSYALYDQYKSLNKIVLSNAFLSNMNCVHMFNMLWVAMNVIDNVRLRLVLQEFTIFALGYFLFESVRSASDNIIVSNVVSFYFGWVVCASYLSTLLTSIYVFKLGFLDNISQLLGIVWGTIGLCLWTYNFSNIYAFYASVAWGLIGILTSNNKTKSYQSKVLSEKEKPLNQLTI